MRNWLWGFCLFAVASFPVRAVWAAQEVYQIDTAHSFANFTIRHVASKTAGSFNDIAGKIVIDRENLANSTVEARIAVGSISTGHAKRDDHLKKPDYLDAMQFGEITFISTKIESKNNTEGVMTGKFTLHGVSKEIAIPFKVLGFGTDPWGGERSGFEAKTVIKASDYGFSWMKKPNAPVGDEIEVTLLIEGLKPPATAPK